MRRMFSEKQIKEMISAGAQGEIAEALEGDIEVGGDLSVGGDLEVTGSINGEENPSVKPIYIHPITIDRELESSDIVHVSLLIFDNSNEEYNTYEKLNAKFTAIFTINSQAVFPMTGAIYYTTSSLLMIAQKVVYDDSTIKLRCVRPNGTLGYFNFSNFSNAEFYDGVNKIN